MSWWFVQLPPVASQISGPAGLEPLNNNSAWGFWPGERHQSKALCVLWNDLTCQSPVELKCPIRVSDWSPQAPLWHLREAQRWKGVWLLSSPGKYLQFSCSQCNWLGVVSHSTLCFIKVNNKNSEYANVYLCLALVLLEKCFAEKSAKPSKVILTSKNALFVFQSISECILCDA